MFFAGRFSSSSQGLIGIALESQSIRMLQIRRHGDQIAVTGAAEELLEAPISEIAKPALTARIRAMARAARFKGRHCAVSLPPCDLHVLSIRLPKMPEKDLQQAAKWEASQRLHTDPSVIEVQALRTGVTLHTGEPREEVILIAAEHKSIMERLQPIIDAGLRPAAVDAGFAAAARLLCMQCRRMEDQHIVRAVVEIEYDGTYVMILRGDEIAFCKWVPIGGRQFDQAVCEHLEFDLPAASELRSMRVADLHSKQLGSSGAEGTSNSSITDSATDRAVFEAIRPLMGELVRETLLCLRYFGVTFRGKPPAELLLTGSECVEPHLDEIFAKGCKMPIVFDDASGTLAQLKSGVAGALGRSPGPMPAWAAAAGLSIRDWFQSRATTEQEPAHAVRRAA